MKHTRYPRLATKQSQSSGLSLLWVGIMSLWNRGCKFSHFMALLINVIKISTQLKKTFLWFYFSFHLKLKNLLFYFQNVKCYLKVKSGSQRFPESPCSHCYTTWQSEGHYSLFLKTGLGPVPARVTYTPDSLGFFPAWKGWEEAIPILSVLLHIHLDIGHILWTFIFCSLQ